MTFISKKMGIFCSSMALGFAFGAGAMVGPDGKLDLSRRNEGEMNVTAMNSTSIRQLIAELVESPDIYGRFFAVNVMGRIVRERPLLLAPELVPGCTNNLLRFWDSASDLHMASKCAAVLGEIALRNPAHANPIIGTIANSNMSNPNSGGSKLKTANALCVIAENESITEGHPVVQPLLETLTLLTRDPEASVRQVAGMGLRKLSSGKTGNGSNGGRTRAHVSASTGGGSSSGRSGMHQSLGNSAVQAPPGLNLPDLERLKESPDSKKAKILCEAVWALYNLYRLRADLATRENEVALRRVADASQSAQEGSALHYAGYWANDALGCIYTAHPDWAFQ